ncbi:MAG: SAM-dependent methyltransferase, partial [Ilumatobacteraceae bacterium]
LVFDGMWRESWVSSNGDSFTEVLRSLDSTPGFVLPERATHGARVPWQQAASDWLGDVLSRLDGRLVILDYAVQFTAELASRPWREWLRTYAGQERGSHYLRDVGRQDITTDVCIDQIVSNVGEPDVMRSQSQFLQRWGIAELVEEGRRVWEAEASRPGLHAMRMRSRISESEALLDSGGLGGFTVLEWVRVAS